MKLIHSIAAAVIAGLLALPAAAQTGAAPERSAKDGVKADRDKIKADRKQQQVERERQRKDESRSRADRRGPSEGQQGRDGDRRERRDDGRTERREDGQGHDGERGQRREGRERRDDVGTERRDERLTGGIVAKEERNAGARTGAIAATREGRGMTDRAYSAAKARRTDRSQASALITSEMPLTISSPPTHCSTRARGRLRCSRLPKYSPTSITGNSSAAVSNIPPCA